uniref:Uncharacterized protein n=1 Tax=Acrobeloides nanus TaxID=290746 RepID=A0A914DSH4_9BILA
MLRYLILSTVLLILPVKSSLRTYTTIYPVEEFEPDSDGKLFRSLEKCTNKCLVKCQKFSIDEEEDDPETTLFVCRKLRPIEKSLPEKLFSSAPIPLVLSAVVLLIITIFVCTCIAWGVCGCCRKRTNRRNDNSSREPLGGIFLEEQVNLEEEKHRTGSKYLSDV